MKNIYSLAGGLILILSVTGLHADESRELQTTIIRGNKEAPQLLYIVPWQNTKNSATKDEQQLTLHSLFGDLFNPVLPSKIEGLHSQ